MNLAQAKRVAEEVKGWLEPYCKRIEIVGSVRRQKVDCGDVELLCIPTPYKMLFDEENKFLWPGFENKLLDLITIKKVLDYRLNSKGSKVYGPKNKLLTHVASGFPVDIFSTDEEGWATALVVRTGSKELNIRIAMEAKKRGWRFNAYGSGFTKEDGTKIVCKTEREIFEAVGLKYLDPWER